MKLYKYNQDETVKYWDTQEEIDIPEYKFNEKDVRGVWVSNVANIDTPSLSSNTILLQFDSNLDTNCNSDTYPWKGIFSGFAFA